MRENGQAERTRSRGAELAGRWCVNEKVCVARYETSIQNSTSGDAAAAVDCRSWTYSISARLSSSTFATDSVKDNNTNDDGRDGIRIGAEWRGNARSGWLVLVHLIRLMRTVSAEVWDERRCAVSKIGDRAPPSPKSLFFSQQHILHAESNARVLVSLLFCSRSCAWRRLRRVSAAARASTVEKARSAKRE